MRSDAEEANPGSRRILESLNEFIGLAPSLRARPSRHSQAEKKLLSVGTG